MKKLLLTSIAALFLATGTAHAAMYVETIEGPKDFCSAFPNHSICAGYTYRPEYDTQPWEAADPNPPPEFYCLPDAGEDKGVCAPLPRPRPPKLGAHADIAAMCREDCEDHAPGLTREDIQTCHKECKQRICGDFAGKPQHAPEGCNRPRPPKLGRSLSRVFVRAN